MTNAGDHQGDTTQPTEPEDPIKELIDAVRALQPRRSRVRSALSWILAACAIPIIANYAVPSARHLLAVASCYEKYLLHSHETTPSSLSWKPFGVTAVSHPSPNLVSIRPREVGDLWFGAVMPFSGYCDYQFSFSAELVGPLDRSEATALGYGYGIGARGTAINGVPGATTVQYDPPSGGLRIVPIPCCANKAGYNPQILPGVIPGIYHRWTFRVIGSTAYINFDGQGFGSMTLGHGSDILIRVWNAGVTIKNIKIIAIAPG